MTNHLKTVALLNNLFLLEREKVFALEAGWWGGGEVGEKREIGGRK